MSVWEPVFLVRDKNMQGNVGFYTDKKGQAFLHCNQEVVYGKPI